MKYLNKKSIDKLKSNNVLDYKNNELAAKLANGDLLALSRAITLSESKKEEDKKTTSKLLNELKVNTESIRIGVSGIPGVGKSTFIEELGLSYINQGFKVAVLAVDPSSTNSKGSILGDKTRMTQLASNANAFVRPSPSGGNLGGVTKHTQIAIKLCEAAGFDRIIIETVGVGQSETAVQQLSDVFMLLTISGTGDELQGIKRGVMELADLIVINKVDEPNNKIASMTKAQLKGALHLFLPRIKDWEVPVIEASALTKRNLTQVLEALDSFIVNSKLNGYFKTHRQSQEIGYVKELVMNLFWQNVKSQEVLVHIFESIKKALVDDYKFDELSADSIVNDLINQEFRNH